MMFNHDILIFGIGNPSRGDDALGIEFIERISKYEDFGARFDCGYQVNAEEAFEVSQSEVVIFVDASLNCPEPFRFHSITPDDHIEYSTHAMEPASVLALTASLFSKQVPGYCLEIRGYDWGLGRPICERASENLDRALDFFKRNIRPLLHSRSFEALGSCHA